MLSVSCRTDSTKRSLRGSFSMNPRRSGELAFAAIFPNTRRFANSERPRITRQTPVCRYELEYQAAVSHDLETKWKTKWKTK